ncbi:MAG: molybdate ABC transporter substrate-binding protein [Candidatus Sumerlaeaceae bacterium]|nr:molybdate ABC transporter substrate-binding protein [Candidatus Sumerlaeaceae bacterium]
MGAIRTYLVALVLPLLAYPASCGTGEVRIAAAADLKFALEEISREYVKSHPQVKVIPAFGSSGNFTAQLMNEAPFDVFLSADMDYPRKLVTAGRATTESLFQYAIGHVVVWGANGSAINPAELRGDVFKDARVKKIALANPVHAPYGRAAEAALKKLGVYDGVKDKLVFGDNVAQAAQFADSGAADIGLIALSLAVSPTMKDKGRYWEIPTDAYPRMVQGGVILKSASDRSAAEFFRDYLLSAEGKAILKRYGFSEDNP